MHVDSTGAAVDELAGKRLAARVVDVPQRDGRAVAAQALGTGRADALARAGDHRHLAL